MAKKTNNKNHPNKISKLQQKKNSSNHLKNSSNNLKNNSSINHKKNLSNIHKKNNSEPAQQNKEIAIVGIGASAGGLEAFSQLLSALPVDTGMAFIFIQHLAPKHESTLTEILSKATKMKVVEIKNDMDIAPNQIFIIPPDKYLSLKDQKLILSERDKKEGSFLPIDHFFRSLVLERGNRAIGIILSGTASDGTLGLRAIKAEGGLTFAQDEGTAKFFGMPYNAINSGYVDFVLPPEKIAKELSRIGNHPYLLSSPDKKREDGTDIEEKDHLTQIFRKLHSATGIDFSHYKQSTIKRRIARRMILNKIDNPGEYLDFIKSNKNEVNELYQDLLINVTHFFRDPEVFETLKKQVYPEIQKNMSSENPIRIWVPGCSTGEEVYSIAISLFEYFGSKVPNINMQFFATDINELSIEKARAGIYPESIAIDVSQEIIKNYFVKIGTGYQISKRIRDICVFARQDIAKDPPFSRIDLISCRNLLIYLSSELQKKIIPIFHYALKPNGYLLLGTSESIGTFADLFTLAESKHKIYTKKSVGHHPQLDFAFSKSVLEIQHANNAYKEVFASDLDLQKEADKLILNKYSPPGFLIKSNLEIIQFRGDVGKYLKPSTGQASLNLFKMIRDGISLELHNALRKVKNTGKLQSIENISFELDGKIQLIGIEILPVKSAPGSGENYFLILFKEEVSHPGAKEEQQKRSKNKKAKRKEYDAGFEKLHEELRVTREHLQSIIEEREATNEELRSALEELQSSNEELQSTNEEMETAKEELQSTNEELITVNEELEKRNEELTTLNSDLVNLLASINLPVIMLDRNLKIRRYTPHAEKIWNLIAGDIGRPISDINPNIKIPGLKEKIAKVIDTLEIQEVEAMDQEGNWYSIRIRPYKSIENKIDGVVLSMFESNIMQDGVDSIIKSLSKTIFNTISEPLIVLKKDQTIIEANKAFMEKLGSTEVIGRKLYEIQDGRWNITAVKNLLEHLYSKHGSVNDYKAKIGTDELVLNADLIKLPDEQDELILIVLKELKP